MKLREKFNDLVPVEFGGMQEPLLTNCVDVAKDFAIGFLEWTESNVYYDGKKHIIERTQKEYTIKQLIDIYIKEIEL